MVKVDRNAKVTICWMCHRQLQKMRKSNISREKTGENYIFFKFRHNVPNNLSSYSWRKVATVGPQVPMSFPPLLPSPSPDIPDKPGPSIMQNMGCRRHKRKKYKENEGIHSGPGTWWQWWNDYLVDSAEAEMRLRDKKHSMSGWCPLLGSAWVPPPEIGNNWEASIMHNMGCGPGCYIAANREQTNKYKFLVLDLRYETWSILNIVPRWSWNMKHKMWNLSIKRTLWINGLFHKSLPALRLNLCFLAGFLAYPDGSCRQCNRVIYRPAVPVITNTTAGQNCAEIIFTLPPRKITKNYFCFQCLS